MSPFRGGVTIDGVAAPVDTVIEVYVGEGATPRATAMMTAPGAYEVVVFGAGVDVGQPVTFVVTGLTAVTTPPDPLFASYEPQTVDLAVP